MLVHSLSQDWTNSLTCEVIACKSGMCQAEGACDTAEQENGELQTGCSCLHFPNRQAGAHCEYHAQGILLSHSMSVARQSQLSSRLRWQPLLSHCLLQQTHTAMRPSIPWPRVMGMQPALSGSQLAAMQPLRLPLRRVCSRLAASPRWLQQLQPRFASSWPCSGA